MITFIRNLFRTHRQKLIAKGICPVCEERPIWSAFDGCCHSCAWEKRS